MTRVAKTVSIDRSCNISTDTNVQALQPVPAGSSVSTEQLTLFCVVVFLYDLEFNPQYIMTKSDLSQRYEKNMHFT